MNKQDTMRQCRRADRYARRLLRSADMLRADGKDWLADLTVRVAVSRVQSAYERAGRVLSIGEQDRMAHWIDQV